MGNDEQTSAGGAPTVVPPTNLTAPTATSLTEHEREEIRTSLARLERGRGVLVRAADLLAMGFGSAARLGARQLNLSGGLEQRMRGLAFAMLTRAYDLAILGLTRPPTRREQRRMNAAVMASGAVGGASGLAGFIPDASMTTLAILRAIAAEALRQGEDLSTDEARQACLEVFLLQAPQSAGPSSQLSGSFSGSPSGEAELSYYAARLLLRGRPLALLMTEAAGRYGLVLSQKLAAQAVPIVGAAAGAALNTAFLSHFRDLAQAHFTLRRIERVHGGQVWR